MGTTMSSERKMERGMLRLGSFTSSPHWAMISYPSKAMKVRPMAMMMPVQPFWKNPLNCDCQGSEVLPANMAYRPNPMNMAMTTILTMVMKLSA
jgi:hypothetical protein